MIYRSAAPLQEGRPLETAQARPEARADKAEGSAQERAAAKTLRAFEESGALDRRRQPREKAIVGKRQQFRAVAPL